MGGHEHEAQMPVVLLDGGVLQFRSTGHLAGKLTGEMAQQCLTAVDTVAITLFEPTAFHLRIMGYPTSFELTGRAVHRSSDIVGLQVDADAAVQSALHGFLESARLHLGEAVETEQTIEEGVGMMAQVEACLGAAQADGIGISPEEEGADDAADDGAESAESDFGGLLADAAPEPTIEQPMAVLSDDRIVPELDAELMEGPLEMSDGPQESTIEMLQGRMVPIRTVRDCLGDGHGTNLFGLLLELQRNCRSGRLTIVTPVSDWSVDLDARGCVTDFEGNLTQALVEDGSLSARNAALMPPKLGVVAQARTLVDRPESFGVSYEPKFLRRLMAEKLVKALGAQATLKDARFFFDGNAQVQSDHRVRIPFLTYAPIWIAKWTSKLRLHDLEAIFEKDMNKVPVLARDERWHAEMLALDRQEKRFVQRSLSKESALRRLLTFSPLNRGRTLRMLLSLVAMDMVAFERRLDKGSEVDVVALLKSRLEHASEGDFDALDCHVTAHEDELRESFEKIEQDFGPQGEAALHSPEAAELCRQILHLATVAWRKLEHRTQRLAYRKTHFSQTELAGFSTLMLDKMKLAQLRGHAKRTRQLREIAFELHAETYRESLRELAAEAEEEDDDL